MPRPAIRPVRLADPRKCSGAFRFCAREKAYPGRSVFASARRILGRDAPATRGKATHQDEGVGGRMSLLEGSQLRGRGRGPLVPARTARRNCQVPACRTRHPSFPRESEPWLHLPVRRREVLPDFPVPPPRTGKSSKRTAFGVGKKPEPHVSRLPRCRPHATGPDDATPSAPGLPTWPPDRTHIVPPRPGSARFAADPDVPAPSKCAPAPATARTPLTVSSGSTCGTGPALSKPAWPPGPHRIHARRGWEPARRAARTAAGFFPLDWRQSRRMERWVRGPGPPCRCTRRHGVPPGPGFSGARKARSCRPQPPSRRCVR